MAEDISPNNGLTKYRQDALEKTVADLLKRVESLEKDLIATRLEREKNINAAKDEVEDEITDLKVEMAKLSSRLTIFQGIQATFTTIAGVVASILGRLP